VATMIGCLPTQALASLAVFVYATHATQAIAFEWKPRVRHMLEVFVFGRTGLLIYFFGAAVFKQRYLLTYFLSRKIMA